MYHSSEEEAKRNKVENENKVAQIVQDHATEITQYDGLVQKVIAGLQQAEADLDSLLDLKKEIEKQPVETQRIINSSLALDAAHLVPTVKANIENAIRLLELNK
jgi:hypothetical protein